MFSKPHILLVDDETAITMNLAPFLERSGFSVDVAADGFAALEMLAQTTPSIIVLDVLMPHMDGREVLRHLRQQENWTPVILLTRIGESTERAMALEEGADDYLNKPFDPYELVARIRAVLRRLRPGQAPLASSSLLVCGELAFDRATRRITKDGHVLSLTPKAIMLLEYLMTHPDEVITRERLLDAVWGWDYPAGTRTVDNCYADHGSHFHWCASTSTTAVPSFPSSTPTTVPGDPITPTPVP
ncbi:MAG: response regulator transcription factor [Chloroflexi bacterium AL-W]|nr:response regulator transcription factor [Chloroflexi bacterium AL-N1]NOK71310.1 response regulator transcription factor [Chloroflexi bacterium AL-N10]NOK77685.1 response regulator transcription factor [Chloroflexi bacterium AL-N5]NOK84536.1 response regulator transcription factor [Chloroflexi bacterium AL-W]NOK92987.1 response regulator transcription factor [Chloroflexi bacterium AL-N15]